MFLIVNKLIKVCVLIKIKLLWIKWFNIDFVLGVLFYINIRLLKKVFIFLFDYLIDFLVLWWILGGGGVLVVWVFEVLLDVFRYGYFLDLCVGLYWLGYDLIYWFVNCWFVIYWFMIYWFVIYLWNINMLKCFIFEDEILN